MNQTMTLQNWAHQLQMAALNSADSNLVRSILRSEIATDNQSMMMGQREYLEREFHRILFAAIGQGSPMEVIEAFLTSGYFRSDYQQNHRTVLLEATTHGRLDVVLKLMELPSTAISDSERVALARYLLTNRNTGLNIARVQGTSPVVYTSVIDNIMTTSVACIDLSSSEEFPDSMLAGMAYTAFCEMIALHTTDGLSDRRLPGAMTALVINGTVFLASSIRGNSDGFQALLPNSNTADILEMIQDGGVPHRTGGNCGECASLHLYYSTHQLANHTQLPQNTRCVTVGRTDDGRFVVFPPCHPRSGWGCNLLTSEMAIRGINAPWMFRFDEIVRDCGWALSTCPAPFLLAE